MQRARARAETHPPDPTCVVISRVAVVVVVRLSHCALAARVLDGEYALFICRAKFTGYAELSACDKIMRFGTQSAISYAIRARYVR